MKKTIGTILRIVGAVTYVGILSWYMSNKLIEVEVDKWLIICEAELELLHYAIGYWNFTPN